MAGLWGGVAAGWGSCLLDLAWAGLLLGSGWVRGTGALCRGLAGGTGGGSAGVCYDPEREGNHINTSCYWLKGRDLLCKVVFRVFSLFFFSDDKRR